MKIPKTDDEVTLIAAWKEYFEQHNNLFSTELLEAKTSH